MQNQDIRFTVPTAAKLLLLDIPILKAILKATGLSHHYEQEGNIGSETLRALRRQFSEFS